MTDANLQSTFNGLVAAMKGVDSLSGWDMLVSYNVVQLNALLAQRAAQLGFETLVNWTVEDTEVTRKLVFDIKLLQPTLRFVDSSNNITVTCGLAGSYHIDGGSKVINIDTGLVVVLSTNLVNVSGEWHLETGFQPKTGVTPAADDYITLLDPNSSVTQGICINFARCKASIENGPNGAATESRLANLSKTMKSNIEQHFASAAGLRYCLAALSNHYEQDVNGSEVLQPTAFCFTMQPDTLLTWIGLKGGPDNGKRQSAKTMLAFAPGSKAMSPIPKGNSASIIFSQDTIVNLFLKPALKVAGSIDGSKDINKQSVATGVKVGFHFKSIPITVPNVHKEDKMGNLRHMDGASVDLSDTLSTFTINGERAVSSQKAVDIIYKSESKRMEWRTKNWNQGANGGGVFSNEKGVCNITFTYTVEGQWTSGDPTKSPNQLGFKFTFGNTLKTTATSDAASGWEKVFGKSDSVPEEYKNLAPTAPVLKIELKNLDYFLATNLLLPGQHIFHAHAPAAGSSDSNSGLASPRDVLLTGDILQNATRAQERSSARNAQQKLMGVASTSPGASSAPTLDSLKEAFLSFPASDLVGATLRNMVAEPSEREPTETFLARYGFGDLANHDFFNIFGTSHAELIEGKPATTVEGPKSLDLRIYGGVYTVVSPEDYEGEVMMVHPTLGSIYSAGKECLATQTYDVEKKAVVVSWLAGSRVYSAQFRLVWDNTTLELGYHCLGTVRSNNAEPRPFEAYLRGYLPEALEPKQVFLKGDDPAEKTVLTYFQLVNTGLTIGLSIYGLYKFFKGKRQEKIYKDLCEVASGLIASKVADELAQHQGLTNAELNKMEKDIKEKVNKKLTDAIADDPAVLKKLKDKDERDKFVKPFVDEVRAALDPAVNRTVEIILGVGSMGAITQDPTLKGVIDQKDIENITQKTTKSISEEARINLHKADLSESMVLELVHNLQVNRHDEELRDFAGQQKILDHQTVTTKAEVRAALDAVEDAQRALREEREAERKPKLEQELRELQAKLERKEQELKKIDKEKQGLNDRALDAERQRKEEEQRREEKRREIELKNNQVFTRKR
ncbi:hypothetical protein ColTof4_14471 [Colletotrichum tofieldiae]|nr:hypothetical protein ColTof4_14471 [Colletotrichum tofieldiae]